MSLFQINSGQYFEQTGLRIVLCLALLAGTSITRAYSLDALSQAYLEQGQRDFDKGDYAAAKRLFNKAAINLEGTAQDTLYAAAIYTHASACYRQLAEVNKDYQDIKDDDLAVAFLRRKLQPANSASTSDDTSVQADETVAAFTTIEDANTLPSSQSLLDRATLRSINSNYRLKLEWLSVNYMRLAMKLQESQLGSDSVAVAYSMESLGLLYNDFDSQLDEAEALFRKALAIREAKEGKSTSDVALNLYGLGTVLKTASDSHPDPDARGLQRKDSVAALERCLSILQSLGLSKSILAARCLGLESTIHMEPPLLDPERAIQEFRNAYEILKKDAAHKKAFDEFRIQHKNQANLALGESQRLVDQASIAKLPPAQMLPLLDQGITAAQRAGNQPYMDSFQAARDRIQTSTTRKLRTH